jgi:hypothetical protein
MHRLPLVLAVAAVLGFAVAASDWFAPRPSTAETLAAAGPLKWYRGNMHTHSYWSDGDDYLENIALWYRERDYDFLCFTDHNILSRGDKWIDVKEAKNGEQSYAKHKARWGDAVVERMRDGKREVKLKTFEDVVKEIGKPGEFLLIQSEEISDKFEKLPIHLNAHNVRDLLPPRGGDSAAEVLQNNIDGVIAQRERTKQPMIVHVNHPNFKWGLTAEDMAGIRGEQFFEVYNGHPGVANSGDEHHASTERIWDIINTQRIAELDLPLLYGLATDDGHNYHNIPSRNSEPGRGWVMVLSAALTPEALIEALEAGRFYASSGVSLDRIESNTDGLKLAVHAEPGVTYQIDFVGTRRGFDPKSEPVVDKDGKELPVTRKYSADIGRVLKSVDGTAAEYQFTGDELYVRARITSSRRHPNPSEPGDYEQAWVQPARGPAAK